MRSRSVSVSVALFGRRIRGQAVRDLQHMGRPVREVRIEPLAIGPSFFSDRIQGCVRMSAFRATLSYSDGRLLRQRASL